MHQRKLFQFIFIYCLWCSTPFPSDIVWCAFSRCSLPDTSHRGLLFHWLLQTKQPCFWCHSIPVSWKIVQVAVGLWGEYHNIFYTMIAISKISSPNKKFQILQYSGFHLDPPCSMTKLKYGSFHEKSLISSHLYNILLRLVEHPNAAQNVFRSHKKERDSKVNTEGVSVPTNIELNWSSHSGLQPVLGNFSRSALMVSIISCSTISSTGTSSSLCLFSSLPKF